MLLNLFSKKPHYSKVTFNSKVILLQPVEVADKNGSIVRKSEFKPFDIAESLAPFKSSDFSITSLESVGALSKLTTTYMSSMHDMNIADKFDNYSIAVDNVQES